MICAVLRRLHVSSDTVIGSAQIGGDRVRRREFLALVSGVSLTWPVAARAGQPARTHRIGILSPGRAELRDPTHREHCGRQQITSNGAARNSVDLGGLMSYEANLPDLARQTATYAYKNLIGYLRDSWSSRLIACSA